MVKVEGGSDLDEKVRFQALFAGSGVSEGCTHYHDCECVFDVYPVDGDAWKASRSDFGIIVCALVFQLDMVHVRSWRCSDRTTCALLFTTPPGHALYS